MKRLLLAGAGLALLFSALPRGADAQGMQIGATVASGGACPSTNPLSPGIGRYVYQTSNGALCISGSITSNSAAVGLIGATAPTFADQIGFLSGANLTNVSGANPLPVTGSFIGALSNASSAVATSSTNIGTVSYNYGFNGTTWDQLQVDGSKYLKVTIAASPASVPVTGTFFQATQPVSIASAQVASGAYPSGSLADGAITTLGTKADAATCATTNTEMACLRQLHADLIAALPAGTNSIGTINSSSHAQTSALASSLVVKASAGTLYTFNAVADSTLNAAAWYVVIFDATSFPGNGAITPAGCYYVAAGQSTLGGNFNSGGEAHATGIVVGVSTTGCFSLTSSAHAFIQATYQ